MTKKLKVLLVTEYFPPKIFGGGEISAYLLAKNLAKNKIDVSVLTSGFEGLKNSEEKDGFKIYRRLHTGENPNSIFQNARRVFLLGKSAKLEIKKLEKEKDFDAIHFLNTTSIVKIKTKAKKIATINSYAPFCPKGNLWYREKSACSGCNPLKFLGCIVNSEYVGKGRMGWYLRYNPVFWAAIYLPYISRRNSLKYVDKFIAISDFVKQILANHKVSGHKISKIYNIAEIPDNNLEIPGLKSRIKGKKVVSTISTLDKIKGVNLAIRSFSKIKGKNAILLIIGDGPERHRLEKLAEKLKIQNKIIFAGKIWQKYIPFIYKNSDLILLTSQWPEPFSRVVMESAYFRKPVLASAIGGNLDLPEKYLFRNENELAQKISLFLSKKQKPMEFAVFEPEKTAKKIISEYLLVNS